MITAKQCRTGPMMFLENDTWTGQSLNVYGENEWLGMEFLLRLLKPEDIVIEAGSFFGQMTVPMAKAVSKGYLIAIEAQPVIFNILCGNISLNNLFNATTVQRLVSDSDIAEMFFGRTDYAHGEQDFMDIQFADKAFPDATPVRTVTIDGLKLARLSLIRFDMGEQTIAALSGASQSIRQHKPFIHIRYRISDENQLVKMVNEFGYKVLQHHFPVFNPDNFAEQESDILRIKDCPDTPVFSSCLFCYHPEKEQRVKPLLDDNFADIFPAPKPVQQESDLFTLPKIFSSSPDENFQETIGLFAREEEKT